MADTVRERATLIGLLADNSTQQISEQDDRDVLMSIMGVYAQLYLTAGASAISVGTAWQTLDWAAGANGVEDAADANYTADAITIGSGAGGVWQALRIMSAPTSAAIAAMSRLSGCMVSSPSWIARLLSRGAARIAQIVMRLLPQRLWNRFVDARDIRCSLEARVADHGNLDAIAL